jgi:hypothetical protein
VLLVADPAGLVVGGESLYLLFPKPLFAKPFFFKIAHLKKDAREFSEK